MNQIITDRMPVICVMGVSASGKSTLGRELALALGVGFVDADDLHPPANTQKMASGMPLTDDDRWPWLDVVGENLRAGAEGGLVVACSALRRVYRDRIRAVAGDVSFVLLHGDDDLLAERAAARSGHFMPPALLASQLATLERLARDERGIVVDIAEDPDTLVAEVITWLQMHESR